MTIWELTEYLYSIIQKDPTIADRDIWKVDIDMNADKSNIKLDSEWHFITIEN